MASAVAKRPKLMQADFMILDKVTTPGLAAKNGGSLVVEAGRPGSTMAVEVTNNGAISSRRS